MFKKKEIAIPENKVYKKTIFDLPIGESHDKMALLIDDIYAIVDSQTFKDLTSKIKIGKGDNVNELIGSKVSGTLKQLLSLILKEKFDNIIRILSTYNCVEVNEYLKKTTMEIVNELDEINPEHKRIFVDFFTSARK